MSRAPWQFDEYQQIGRDYTAASEVQVYDESHAQFRDIVAESNETLDRLNLAPGEVLIDIGCGTGTFAIEAVKRGLTVHAADVSRPMLEYARQKADGFEISFHHAGFLTLDLSEQSCDAITTTYAFHHLPDFWKGIAFQRLHEMLKPSGQLYLRDVILDPEEALQNIAKLIEHQERLGGEFLREDAVGHFRDEHSTYDWVIDGLLQRTGFSIVSKKIEHGVLGSYYCKKTDKNPSAPKQTDPTS